MRLLREGHQPVEVAEMVGVDRRSVRRWKAAYREEGRKGIAAKPAPGRPPKLSDKQKMRLEKMLLKGAEAAGFPSNLWTCSRVVELIRKRLGVSYHVNHVGRVLRSLGWSPQKPSRRAIERDEEAIAQWKRTTWRSAKKKSYA